MQKIHSNLYFLRMFWATDREHIDISNHILNCKWRKKLFRPKARKFVDSFTCWTEQKSCFGRKFDDVPFFKRKHVEFFGENPDVAVEDFSGLRCTSAVYTWFSPGLTTARFGGDGSNGMGRFCLLRIGEKIGGFAGGGDITGLCVFRLIFLQMKL